MLKKMPPPEKVQEAWSALADGRVELASASGKDKGSARVRSSNDQKTYQVSWQGPVFSSTDNASFWQGYPGYPIIAVLMKLGYLPYHEENAKLFKGIDWNAANKAARGNYAKALATILANLNLEPEKEAEIQKQSQEIIHKLAELDINLKRPKKADNSK